MKLLFCVIVTCCIVIHAASGAEAQAYRDLSSKGGVQVMVAIDPLGPNNQIAANIRFVNQNSYRVNVIWTPVITCEGEPAKKGYGSPFSMNAAASYEVRLWRSSACTMGPIKDLKVEMEVSTDAPR